MTLKTREGIAAIDARLSCFRGRKADLLGGVVPHIGHIGHLHSSFFNSSFFSLPWHEDRQGTCVVSVAPEGPSSATTVDRGPTTVADRRSDAVPDRRFTAGGFTAVLSAELGADRGAPGQARRMLIAALRRGDCEDRLIQDAALVLTELAANAVLHACSPFSVSVSSNDGTLRIAVGDKRPLGSTRASRQLVPHLGRGLGLIDAISACWGTSPASGGKIVWAELRM